MSLPGPMSWPSSFTCAVGGLAGDGRNRPAGVLELVSSSPSWGIVASGSRPLSLSAILVSLAVVLSREGPKRTLATMSAIVGLVVLALQLLGAQELVLETDGNAVDSGGAARADI